MGIGGRVVWCIKDYIRLVAGFAVLGLVEIIIIGR